MRKAGNRDKDKTACETAKRVLRKLEGQVVGMGKEIKDLELQLNQGFNGCLI